MLELAYTTDHDITPYAVAYFAPCSIDDAQRVLDDLVAQDRIVVELGDDGTLYYHLRGRQRVAPPPLVVHRHVPNPIVGAMLSLVLPGAGQAYAGRWLVGALWFVLVVAGYSLIFPGLLLHLICIASAAASADRTRLVMQS